MGFFNVKKMQQHEKFMQMAIELSEQNVSKRLGGPFGAIIVKDGVLVAESANTVLLENDPTAHAEISAIRLACKALGIYDLSGCTIFTSCEPCPMCLGAIYWANIDKVFYANTKQDAADIGFDDHLIYKEIKKDMEKRRLPFEQIMHSEALVVFKVWQKSEMKNKY